MYIFIELRLAKSLKLEETMLNAPESVVTCCGKSVMFGPSGYEPCSGHMSLNCF